VFTSNLEQYPDASQGFGECTDSGTNRGAIAAREIGGTVRVVEAAGSTVFGEKVCNRKPQTVEALRVSVKTGVAFFD
jgi:hypothetical protein